MHDHAHVFFSFKTKTSKLKLQHEFSAFLIRTPTFPHGLRQKEDVTVTKFPTNPLSHSFYFGAEGAQGPTLTLNALETWY